MLSDKVINVFKISMIMVEFMRKHLNVITLYICGNKSKTFHFEITNIFPRKTTKIKFPRKEFLNFNWKKIIIQESITGEYFRE